MKNTKTEKIAHSAACVAYTVFLVVLVCVSRDIETDPWLKGVFGLFFALSLVIVSLYAIMAFEEICAREKAERLESELNSKSEIVRIQRNVMEKRESALTLLYCELSRIDPDNETLKHVEDKVLETDRKNS